MRKLLVLIVMFVTLRASIVYETDFENCTDSMPPGWIIYNLNGDAYALAAVNYSGGAHRGRSKSRYATQPDDNWIMSDTFRLIGNTLATVEFYVRVQRSSYPEKLRVYLVRGDRPSDTVILLWRNDSITNTSYQLKKIVFHSPGTSIYRLGFYANSNLVVRNVKVDDVSISAEDLASDDIAVTDVSPYLNGWISDTLADTLSQFTVTVRNLGTTFHSNVITYYRVDSAGVTITGPIQIGGDNFSGGDEHTYTFTWNPSIYHMAEYDIYIYHNVSDDNSSNDTFHMHFIVKGHQGKDVYGWVWRDSYSLLGSPSPVQWIELSNDNGAENLNLTDDGNAFRNLASSILFYGTEYYGINISSNGIISFDKQPTYSYSNDSIPSSNASAAIMPFWEDLDPSSGGDVYFKTIDDTLTVIEWFQVPIYNMDSTVTFEVQIESDLAQNGVFDNITFLYYNMQYDKDYMDATIGIQDSSAQNGSGKFLYYTYNEQPYIPNWKNTKGIFAIKFYSPEALQVRDIAYEYMGKSKLYFAMQNAIDIGLEFTPVDVQIYTITGRRVNLPFQYNGHSLKIDFNKVSKGIYFVDISAPGKREKFRVIRLK